MQQLSVSVDYEMVNLNPDVSMLRCNQGHNPWNSNKMWALIMDLDGIYDP